MSNRRLITTLSAFVLCAPMLYGQDAPSLGDIARRVRADKSKTPSAAAPAAASAPDVQDLARLRNEAAARDADANLHQLQRYEENIRVLFNLENFEKIDQLADTARATRSRLTGGFWTIHILYQPLMSPPADSPTDSEWQLHLDRLNRWLTQRPNSITARVALAGAYVGYAWSARGNGMSDSVTENGWKLFNERLDTAGKVLADAFALPDKCPEWFLTMLRVVQYQQRSRQMQDAMFEKATAFEPDYQYYYRARAEMLLPQWDGEEGEMAVFAGKVADRIGGKKGDMIYYEIASFVNCFCDSEKHPHGLAWPRIKSGYTAVEEQYGASLVKMNQMAKFAAAAGDGPFAHELFERIGQNWDQDTWHDRKTFEGIRAWAGFSEIAKESQAGPKKAEANLKTPAGLKFSDEVNKIFQARYGEILKSCQVLLGDSSFTPFDLALELGATGIVEQVVMLPMSRVSMCLADKASKDHFPPPPQPSYWVKVGIHSLP